jgi:fatty-acyl-CoA synthase
MNEIIVDWIRKHAKNTPQKIAMKDISSDREISYRDLDIRVDALAWHLKSLGIKKGDRVAALSQTNSDVVEMQHAAWRLGAVFVALNFRLALAELEYVINDSAPKVLFCDALFCDVKLALRDKVTVEHWLECDGTGGNTQYEQAIKSAQPIAKAIPLSADDHAQILYSSGTTGRPKGVVLSHKNILFCLTNVHLAGGAGPNMVSACFMPLFHISGIQLANMTLFSGGCALMLNEFNPEKILQLINSKISGINYFLGVPTIFELLKMHPLSESTDFSRIGGCYVGGAAVSTELLAWWSEKGVPISQVYGLTETASMISIADPEDVEQHPRTIGKPMFFTEFRVIRQDGGLVDIDEVGELLVKGPSVTPGYWNNPQATQEAFIDDWLKTGDMAAFDKDGFYYIKDRSKDMYISGGENVYPAEVENILCQMPEIQEVAVIGVADEKWSEVGCAVVTLTTGSTLNLEAVEAFCLHKLAKYKWPKHLVVEKELPHNATGKVMKHKIRDTIRETMASLR